MSLKQDLIEQPSSSYFGWWTSRRLVRTAAKGLATRLGDNEGLGDAYRLHGIYYKKWGKYSESLDAYTSSLEIYKKLFKVGEILVKQFHFVTIWFTKELFAK